MAMTVRTTCVVKSFSCALVITTDMIQILRNYAFLQSCMPSNAYMVHCGKKSGEILLVYSRKVKGCPTAQCARNYCIIETAFLKTDFALSPFKVSLCFVTVQLIL